MSFSVSPLFDPFAISVAAQPHHSATEDRERGRDDAKRRHHRYADTHPAPAPEPASPSPDPNAPLPTGTLIDVHA